MNHDDLIWRLRDASHDERLSTGALYAVAADALEAERLKRQQAEHERDSILEDLAGAEKDAKRYRWLFGHDLGDIGHRYQAVWRAWDGDGGCAGFNKYVDAALAQEQKRG